MDRESASEREAVVIDTVSRVGGAVAATGRHEARKETSAERRQPSWPWRVSAEVEHHWIRHPIPGATSNRYAVARCNTLLDRKHARSRTMRDLISAVPALRERPRASTSTQMALPSAKGLCHQGSDQLSVLGRIELMLLQFPPRL